MPKNPIDYNNNIIYKIVCKDLSITELYIGSTTNFIRRKYSHKRNSMNSELKDATFKIYEIIRNNGGWLNWDMIEVERYPCADLNASRARERYWYEELKPTMNSIRPKISREELKTYKNTWKRNSEKCRQNKKKYHEEHRTERLEKMKIYRAQHIDNSDEAKEKRRLYMIEYRKKQKEKKDA